jgi:hypothetical protein
VSQPLGVRVEPAATSLSVREPATTLCTPPPTLIRTGLVDGDLTVSWSTDPLIFNGTVPDGRARVSSARFIAATISIWLTWPPLTSISWVSAYPEKRSAQRTLAASTTSTSPPMPSPSGLTWSFTSSSRITGLGRMPASSGVEMR